MDLKGIGHSAAWKSLVSDKWVVHVLISAAAAVPDMLQP